MNAIKENEKIRKGKSTNIDEYQVRNRENKLLARITNMISIRTYDDSSHQENKKFHLHTIHNGVIIARQDGKN